MANYSGGSFHVYTGQESSVHTNRVREAIRKERAYLNDIVRAINTGNYRRAEGILDDYRDNYPSSNVFTKPQIEGIVSQLEKVIHSNQPFAVEITSTGIVAKPNEKGRVVRPFKPKQ